MPLEFQNQQCAIQRFPNKSSMVEEHSCVVIKASHRVAVLGCVCGAAGVRFVFLSHRGARLRPDTPLHSTPLTSALWLTGCRGGNVFEVSSGKTSLRTPPLCDCRLTVFYFILCVPRTQISPPPMESDCGLSLARGWGPSSAAQRHGWVWVSLFSNRLCLYINSYIQQKR